MGDATQNLMDEARKAQRAVYLATDPAVADDLSRIIGGLADALEAAQRPPVSPEVREALVRVISEAESAVDDEGAWALPEDVADAILAEFYVTSPPVYDVEAVGRFIHENFNAHRGAGGVNPHSLAAALVAALPELVMKP